MVQFRHYFDITSIVVILTTFALFVAALYFTGFTHDLLLEAGVFLVSVKLILMSYRNTVAADNLHKELQEIRSLIQDLKSQKTAE